MTISRRSFVPLLFGMAMLFGQVPAGATADGPDLFRVTGVASWDKLNLRAGPSASYKAIGAIPHDGRAIENIGGCVGEWCRVRYDGVIGWAHTGYLAEDWDEFPPATTYRVVGVAWNDALNIRTGPSAGYPVIGAIPADGVDVVRVGGCQNNWCRIRHGDTLGWVNTKYLTPDI